MNGWVKIVINHKIGSYSNQPPSKNMKSYGGKSMNKQCDPGSQGVQMVRIPLEEYTKLTRDSAELEFLKKANWKHNVVNNLNIEKHHIKPTKNTHTIIDWFNSDDFANRHRSTL